MNIKILSVLVLGAIVSAVTFGSVSAQTVTPSPTPSMSPSPSPSPMSSTMPAGAPNTGFGPLGQ